MLLVFRNRRAEEVPHHNAPLRSLRGGFSGFGGSLAAGFFSREEAAEGNISAKNLQQKGFSPSGGLNPTAEEAAAA